MSSPTRKCVIVFVGTVGVGKSTQIRLLASELKSRGLRVKTSFLKTGHLITYLLDVVLARILSRKKDVSPMRVLVEEKPNLFKRLFKLWLTLDVISVSVKFLLGIYIPAKLGYTVIVEEYLPATVADYIYLSKAVGLSPKVTSFALPHILRLLYLGGQMQVIFQDADVERLRTRWNHRKSLSERPEYLHMQRTLLLSLCMHVCAPHGLLCTNTSGQSIEETHQHIVNFLVKSCVILGHT